MKASLTFLLLLTFFWKANDIEAQSSLNYTILNSSTDSLATDNYGNPITFTGGEPLLVPTSSSNVISSLQPIGFDFIFMGRYYTHFVVGSNGDVGLGLFNSANILGSGDWNSLTRTVVYPPTTNNAPVLAAFWDKMNTPSGSGPTVRAIITGTAPNRCKVIDFNTVINFGLTPVPSAKFQMRLYEGSGIIEYVYGNMSIVPSSTTVTASIGFTAGLNDNQFLALQNLTSFPFTAIASQEPPTRNLVNSSVPGNIIGLHSTADGQRRAFTFTPPALTGTTPTGLQVMEVGATNVTLKWNDTYSNESGYTVLVSSDNVNFLSAGTTGPDATFFNVGNLTLGNTYYFRVIAFTDGACSPSSNTVNATTSCFLNGTYTIGPGGNYTTLAKAIDSIKVKGVTGNVIFELTSSYTGSGEVFPITFPKISQIPCFNNFNITVRPAASATNLQIMGSMNGPLMVLDGVNNYITIDGRPGGTGTTGQLRIINTDAAPVLRLLNSSNNKFLYVKFGGGNLITGFPGYEGVVNLEGSLSGGSDNNKFAFCDVYGVANAAAPTPKPILFYSSAVSGAENNNDSLINCNFYDFYRSAVSLIDYNEGWVIQSNSFYSTGNGLYANTTAVLKIDANFTLTPHKVTQNYFGGTAPNCQGNVMDIGYVAFYCMDIKGKSTVSNNYFRRMRFYNVSSLNNSVVHLLEFRDNFNSEPYVIENNQFGWSSDIADSLHFSHNYISGPPSIQDMEAACIFMWGGVGSINNNKFSNIRCHSATNRISLNIIRGGSVVTPHLNIQYNTIGDPSVPNSIVNYTIGPTFGISLYLGSNGGSSIVNHNTICRMSGRGNDASASLMGIYMQGTYADSTCYNTIFHLINGNGGVSSGQALFGMSINPNNAGGLGNAIEGNHIYSLVQDFSSNGGNVTGIQVSRSMNIRKNYIHNLYTTNTNNLFTVVGIDMPNKTSILENNMISLGLDSLGNSITSGKVVFVGISGGDVMRHNSVYIGGNNVTDGTIGLGSWCFSGSGTGVQTQHTNNIYFNARSNVNASSPARHQCANITSAIATNFNMYYFTGTGGIMGTYAGTQYASLAAWQAGTGFDLNSLFNNPSFIIPAGNNNSTNLHVNPGSPIDGAGTSATTLITDFDNEIRSTLTPVDIGADAFSIAPGIISFTPTSAATGATVTITGTNFTGATAVSFGGVAAASFIVVNSTTITAVVGTGATGSVSVTTPNGTGTKTGFTFIPAPTITSFTPTSGGTGATITISGTGFTGATAVSFGGTAATSFIVVNSTTITAVVASGATGSVSVTTPGGTATLAGFTFIPAPTIISFNPTSGATGATITITGTNFTGATAVSFGGTAASSFTVVNATTITAVVGGGATGNVSVTTPGGTAILAGFVFIPAPTIISFTPTSGATGATITITGTNFTGATAVSFGGTAAASFIVVNVTTITAVVATGSTGSVSVTTPGGTAILAGFTFIPAPTIISFNPTSGATGATITITGTNFTGATAVSFGGTAASSFTVVNATTITAVVASGATGSVSVTTPGGTATLGGFTFIPAPTILSFNPTSGATGATITITGTNFTGATAVSFGGTTASSFTVVNATTITAVVGSGATGNVSVTTPGGTGSLAGFTFIPGPTILSFTPASGTTGTVITITGINFTGTTVISFGGVTATSFTVINATMITAVVGTGASGNITVSTPGGTATLAGFTYTIVTSVGDPSRNNSKELLVSPNPASDMLLIKHPASIKNSFLKLIDMGGRTIILVSVGRNLTQTSMSVKGIASGIYKLIWTDNKLTYRRTVIIAQ